MGRREELVRELKGRIEILDQVQDSASVALYKDTARLIFESLLFIMEPTQGESGWGEDEEKIYE